MNGRISKNLAQFKPGTLFVEIDIAKIGHVASIMAENAKVLDRFKVDNSKSRLSGWRGNAQQALAAQGRWYDEGCDQ